MGARAPEDSTAAAVAATADSSCGQGACLTACAPESVLAGEILAAISALNPLDAWLSSHIPSQFCQEQNGNYSGEGRVAFNGAASYPAADSAATS